MGGHGGDDARARPGDAGSADRHGGDMPMAGHEAADPIRGLAVSDRGLRLSLAATSLPRGTATTLRFAVRDARGPVRDFEVTHEKRMHLIVVRRDGRGFQHLHPTLGADGTWSAPITLPDAGAYRVFADFQRDGRASTLASDLTVDGDAGYAPFPAPTTHAETDGYTVELDAHGDDARLRDHARRQAGPDRALPRRRRPPGRAARGRSRVPARPPVRRRRRVRDRARQGQPLSPVPAVQARRPRPHRGVHAMSTTIELPITGMTCASCANRIERKLNKLDGVHASVNYATEKATVDYDPAAVEPDALVGAVEAAGYHAKLPTTENDTPEADETAPLRFRLILSAILSLPVLLVSMIPALQFDNWQWLALNLATPVVLWGAWPFHQAAWANLRHGTATMDTLISLGTLSAWLWSLYALIFGEAGMAGMRMSFDLIPQAGRRRRPHLPRDGRGRHHLHPRRPLLRGARQAPRRRRVEGAARARGQGGHAARRPPHRASSS